MAAPVTTGAVHCAVCPSRPSSALLCQSWSVYVRSVARLSVIVGCAGSDVELADHWTSTSDPDGGVNEALVRVAVAPLVCVATAGDDASIASATGYPAGGRPAVICPARTSLILSSPTACS